VVACSNSHRKVQKFTTEYIKQLHSEHMRLHPGKCILMGGLYARLLVYGKAVERRDQIEVVGTIFHMNLELSLAATIALMDDKLNSAALKRLHTGN